MSLNQTFSLNFTPMSDAFVRYGEKTYTFSIKKGSEQQIYKNCTFLKAKARCSCGFYRWTKQGYFKQNQIDQIKNHTGEGYHQVTVTLNVQGYKK